MRLSIRVLCALCLALLLRCLALAQDAAPAFSGTTFDGRSFDLARQRGRVVLVVLWRTDCVVCLNKMPELRANALGWKDSPFDLVLLNVDPQRGDAARYDGLRRQLASAEGPVLSLWQGDANVPTAWAAPARWPLTWVIDREGRIAARHEGRIPPEVWNQVADLLP